MGEKMRAFHECMLTVLEDQESSRTETSSARTKQQVRKGSRKSWLYWRGIPNEEDRTVIQMVF